MIRKAIQQDDFVQISRIYAAAWRDAYKNIIPPDYLASLSDDNWCALLESGSVNSLVALHKGLYIGTCAYCPAREEEFAGWGEIVSVYLLSNYQRTGTGSRLIEQAEKNLKALGFYKIYLWVLAENKTAQQFYAKHGYTVLLPTATTEIGGKKLEELRLIKTLN